MIKRHQITLDLVHKIIPDDKIIFDLGQQNEMSLLMAKDYQVINNTPKADFDKDQQEIIELSQMANVCTSFEVFEHLLNPYAVLKSIVSPYMLCTVPLNTWFKKAHWDKTDRRDRHFHEFEQRQFLWLLEETGWDVISYGTFSASDKMGLMYFLRILYPNYLYVLAKRI